MLGTLKNIASFIHKIPGEERFGFYRFLPIFFTVGACIEFTMIKWTPNGHNFYDTFLKNRAHEEALEQLSVLGELEALLAGACGSQCVHLIYRPLDVLPIMVEEEKEKLRLRVAKIKQSQLVNDL